MLAYMPCIVKESYENKEIKLPQPQQILLALNLYGLIYYCIFSLHNFVYMEHPDASSWLHQPISPSHFISVHHYLALVLSLFLA